MLRRARAGNRHDGVGLSARPCQNDRVRRAFVLRRELLHNGKLRNLFRQATTAGRTVSKESDLSPRALLGHLDRLAKVRIQSILHGLNFDDRARLIDLLDTDIAQTDVFALVGALQIGERLDALLEGHARIRSMELVEPDLIGAEGPEASLA